MTDSTKAVLDELIPADSATSQTPVAAYGLTRTQRGQENTLLDQVRASIDDIRNDAGCQQYEVHAVIGDPGAFMFYECWASGPDLLRHVQQPFMATYWGYISGLLDGEFQTHWVKPIGL